MESESNLQSEADPTGPEPTEQSDREAMPVDTEESPRLEFPVVGIGASAGGLEAVTEMLSTIRPDSGMAYIFLQHLPPTGESLLAEILSKRVSIPVHEVDHEMPVKKDHLYCARPGRTLEIKEGKFRLGESLGRPMHNRPVDDFFKSLAREQRERAVAVVLSGMGSNGAAGAQAIKAVGGLCIAQEPETAQFPSMPRHLIEAGYADYILRPSDIAEALLAYARHPYAKGDREEQAELAKRDQQHLREILAILRTRTRQDFNGYKKPTIFRRVQRRMGICRFTKLGEYCKFLRQNPTEVSALADDLLIHVTGFFRDPQAWESLRTQVIVPLIASREPGSSIRCWVTACSSGEEAYSLAMLLVEECDRVNKTLDIKIFATDMADRTLQNARSGTYPGGIEAEIEPMRLERFFQRIDAVYRVRQELRELVVFAPQNLLHDPPFSRLDIASCRNLLIYLDPVMQQRVIGLLHFGLREGGTLFLGTSETANGEDLFQVVDKKARIFRRVGPTRHASVDFPLPRSLHSGKGGSATALEKRTALPRTSIAQLTARALLEEHTPAAVTIDRDYRIVYFHGNVDPYIASPRGEPTRNLMELARDGVRGAVRAAVHRATSTNTTVSVQEGWIENADGQRLRIEIIASPLDRTGTTEFLVVSFQQRVDQPASERNDQSKSVESDSAEALQRVRNDLQSTIEELQTSNEELKASNEEVVSTNEELQSSNEELETSREEMQSLNEELNTVNSQLHSKMEELQASTNDLASLLSSTDIAVLFLDTKLRIRRFTSAMRRLMDLIPSDAGRPINDMARKFEDLALLGDLPTVLENLVPIEREVIADDDRWYLRRVLPYRTADNHIDGVVVMFVDITERKNAETELASELACMTRLQTLYNQLLVVPDLPRALEEILDTMIALHGADKGTLQTYDPADDSLRYAAMHGFDPSALDSIPVIDRNYHSTCAMALRTGHRVVASDFVTQPQFANHAASAKVLGYRAAISRPMTTKKGQLQGVITVHFKQPHTPTDRELRVGDLYAMVSANLVERLHAEMALRASEERFRAIIQNAKNYAILTTDSAGIIDDWMPGAQAVFGWSAQEVVGQTASVLFSPEDRADGVPALELETARLEGISPDVRQHVRKDGSRVSIDGSVVPLRDSSGKITGFLKIGQDVTDRQNANEKIRQSEQRLRAMAANLPGGAAYLVGPDLRYQLAVGQALATAGFTSADLEGKTLDEALSPGLAAEYTPYYRRALAGEPFVREHTDHGREYISHGVPLRDATGQITAMLAVSYDITQYKHAELALRDSRERLRAVADLVPDLMWSSRPDGQTDWCNRRWMDYTGQTLEQAVGWGWTDAIHADERETSTRLYKQATLAGTPLQQEFRIRRHDGVYRWFLVRAEPMRDQNNQITTWFGSATDIDEQRVALDLSREHEKLQRESRAVAEEANRLKDEFLATLSHELRTPLSSMLLWTQLLLQKPQASGFTTELNSILSSARAQKTLIEDLLDMSRITSGTLRLQLRRVDLAKSIRQSLAEISASAHERQIDLRTDISSTIGPLSADPDRIRQIMLNLLSNAVKFTPAGGKVEISAHQLDGHVEVQVRDSGMGISPEFLPHIFERFRQADSAHSRSVGGLGLGLAIVKQLVELHGGSIGAQSQGINQGATFIVRLPLSKVSKDKSPGVETFARTANPVDKQDALTSLMVLLVEDDKQTRDAIAAHLTHAGLQVIATENSESAMNAVREHNPDLIISDIGLPGEDGYALIRNIRRYEADHHLPATPALALTAFAGEANLRKAIEAGFQLHLSKPIDPEQIFSALRELVSPD